MSRTGCSPRASSRSSSRPAREIVLGRREKLAGGLRIVLELRVDHAQLQGDGDEALLSAVVQVALESPALGVADRHELGTRRGQPLTGVGVGQRLPDEVREVAEPLLEPIRQRLVRRGGRHQRAPQPARNGDRRRHRGAVAGASQGLGQAPARFVVALHALGGARAQHLRDDRVAVEVERRRPPATAACRPRSNRRRPSPSRGPWYWTTAAPGSPNSRPTSSVTCSNTPLGGDSAATSVATLRSAACSSASSRWAASLTASARAARVRSAVTAASRSEVRAAVAMKSCVASRLSVIESRTNGPSSWAVFHTVIEHTHDDRRGGASRAQAQRRPEEHREHDVRHVALRCQLGESPRARPARSRPPRRRAGECPSGPGRPRSCTPGRPRARPMRRSGSRCERRARARPRRSRRRGAARSGRRRR